MNDLIRERVIDISIRHIVIVQLVSAMVLAGITVSFGWPVASSTLLGGMSVAMPSAFMAWRLRESAIPEVALARMISAEIGKWMLTGLMVGAVFVWVESLRVGFFFLGLVTTYGCGLVAILLNSNTLISDK